MENKLKTKPENIKQILAYYVIFKNRVMFRDFWLPRAWGRYYKTRYYQYPPALCDDVAVFGGRSCGKSVDLEGTIVQTALNEPSQESVVTAFRRLHVRDRLEKVISFLYNVKYWRKFLLGDAEKSLKTSVRRSPTYEIKLKNRHTIYGISTGDDPLCVNLMGSHPCLSPDQAIKVKDSHALSIKDIVRKLRKGEIIYVQSYNFRTHKIEYKKVIDGWTNDIGSKKLLRIVLEDNSSILVTNNHKIYTKENKGKPILKQAGNFKIGDNIISDEPELSNGQLSLIIGSLLGDGSFAFIDSRTTGKKSKKKYLKKPNYRLAIGHTGYHSEYVKFKMNIADNLTHIKKIKIIKRSNSLGETFSSFHTKSLLVLSRLYPISYKNRKKIITKKLLDLVDEKALAIWFMDDGSARHTKNGLLNGAYLHTQRYTYKENLLLQKWFKKRWNIECKIDQYKQIYKNKERKYCKLRFAKINGLKLINIVIPYMHKLFMYKVCNIDINHSLLSSKIGEFFIKEYKNKNGLLDKKIVKIIEEKKPFKVYDISVEDNKNYFLTSGTLVSNCYRYGEEMQNFLRGAWIQFQSARDPKFVRDRFYGTVDGRIDTPYHDCDEKISKFKNKRFHLSRRLEPWFNQETKNNLIETFKGEDSNEFKQQCDGEWGEPVWGVWPEKDIIKCLNKKEDPQQPGVFVNQITTIILTPKDYANMSPDQVLWSLPKLPSQDLEVIMGIDGGYTEPTVILPFFYYKNKWNLRCKILLRDKMIADDQAELIDYICDFYNAMIISFDCTSAEGRSIAQALTNPKRQEYVSKKYPERVVHVNFNSTEVIGYTDKNRNFREGEEDKVFEAEEIKEKVKNLTTIELYKMFSNHMFDIYYDEDLLGEFNSEVQKKSPSGNYLILTPRNVHIPESFRCFVMGWWKKYGKVDRPERKSNNYSFVLPEYGDSGVYILGKGKAKQKPVDAGID